MVAVLDRVQSNRSPQPAHDGNPRLDYRPDIDGLRAVAILSVVAFHLSPDVLRGGFLGVDVFFVISGFLISTIIFKGLANDGFSFTDFYAHRIRRIFPGLVLVIAVCLFVGWHALLPTEFVLLGKHVIASTLFTENFRLWREAGYFDISTSLKPLMHLWSLAIEEQFYLVFPLILWVGWRLRLNLFAIVATIFAASFAFYLHDVDHQPIAAFFSPKSRFWELMVGAILAYAALHHPDRLQAVRNIGRRHRGDAGTGTAPGETAASLLGLALLAVVIGGLNLGLPFANLMGEGFAVLGSALLIFAGPTALVNRLLLSNGIAVFVGLISYPLYLWHWPLLSFLTIIDGTYPPLHQRAIAVAASFVLATLTYRFVELRIRRGKIHHRQSTIGLVAGMLSMLVLGIFSRYIAPHYDREVQQIMQAWDFAGYPFADSDYVDDNYQLPAVGFNRNNKIVFVGDSHTMQYRQTVEAAFQRQNAKAEFPRVIFWESTNSGVIEPDEPPFKTILSDNAVEAVVFSEFWALQRTSPKINYSSRCCGDGLMRTMGSNIPPPLSQDRIDQINENFKNEVGALKRAGKEVYVILDNPFGEELAPRSLLDRGFFHKIRIKSVTLSKAAAIERTEPARSAVAKIATEMGAHIIDPMEFLCEQNTCRALTADGLPRYRDYDHLSQYTLTHEVHYLDFLLQQPAAE